MSFDVVALGEVMLRYSVPPGERIETAPRYHVGIGGAEANVAVALSRMGRSAAWISRLPQSPLGHRVSRALAAQGVDVGYVSWDETARMGTYYVELSVPPRPAAVVYDREHSAASRLRTRHVDWSIVESCRVAYVSGITPALSESCREVTFELFARAAAAGVPVVFDVNYRSRLWPKQDAVPVLSDLCRRADVVIITAEDAGALFDVTGQPESVVSGIASHFGADRVVVTHGPDGASFRDGGETGAAAGPPAEIVDPIGAGDAFTAGVIIGLLDGSFAEGVELGAVMGAIEVGLWGDMFTVDADEVETIRRGVARDVDR